MNDKQALIGVVITILSAALLLLAKEKTKWWIILILGIFAVSGGWLIVTAFSYSPDSRTKTVMLSLVLLAVAAVMWRSKGSGSGIFGAASLVVMILVMGSAFPEISSALNGALDNARDIWIHTIKPALPFLK